MGPLTEIGMHIGVNCYEIVDSTASQIELFANFRTSDDRDFIIRVKSSAECDDGLEGPVLLVQ